jgi:hypothetical protein
MNVNWVSVVVLVIAVELAIALYLLSEIRDAVGG